MSKINIVSIIFFTMLFHSCDNDNNLSVECNIDDLNIVTIDARSWNDWIYYSFDLEQIVNVTNPDNSLNWDIAFKRNHIKTNGGDSGIGEACGIVNQNEFWSCDSFQSVDEIPENLVCEYDMMIIGTGIQPDPPYEGCYDLMTHSFTDCIKNPALDSWGWFDSDYHFNITDYMLFIRDASGNDIKLWLLSYYNDDGSAFIDMAFKKDF